MRSGLLLLLCIVQLALHVDYASARPVTLEESPSWSTPHDSTSADHQGASIQEETSDLDSRLEKRTSWFKSKSKEQIPPTTEAELAKAKAKKHASNAAKSLAYGVGGVVYVPAVGLVSASKHIGSAGKKAVQGRGSDSVSHLVDGVTKGVASVAMATYPLVAGTQNAVRETKKAAKARREHRRLRAEEKRPMDSEPSALLNSHQNRPSKSEIQSQFRAFERDDHVKGRSGVGGKFVEYLKDTSTYDPGSPPVDTIGPFFDPPRPRRGNGLFTWEHRSGEW
ncbi:hypothetical protein CBS101457_004861 [Exobasidium rhododendri]|nr:hypothetical protein CBS101457_004861 [Exobasidium rhododendri]